jgi:hypothetical protein
MIFVRRLWLAAFLMSTFMAAIIKAIDDTPGIISARVCHGGGLELGVFSSDTGAICGLYCPAL